MKDIEFYNIFCYTNIYREEIYVHEMRYAEVSELADEQD